MPEGWAWIRQKNLGIALNGKAFKPSDWTKKGLPIVRIQNLNDKNASYNYYDKDIDETFLLHGGELLFAWSGTPGTSFGAHIWDKGEAVLNQHIFKILFDETIINKIFYKYCLNNQVEKLIEVAHGSAGLAHITKNMFDEVLIPLPPYNEQLRIVSEFEKTISLINCINDNKTELNDTIKQAKSKILDLAIHGKLVPQDPNDEPAEDLLKRIATSDNRPYEKFKESEELFEVPENWSWCYLKETCTDFIVPQRDKPKVFDGTIPWCRIEDIEGKYLNGSLSNQLVSKDTIKQMNMHICPVGSVICSCSASLGIQAITTIECCTNQTFIGIVPIESVLYNEYLFYYLKAQTKYFHEIATGTTIKYISRDKFEELPFALPPFEEQKRIVSKIENFFTVLDEIVLNLV